jgi:hypothetical protein
LRVFGILAATFAALLSISAANALDFRLQTVRVGNCGEQCPQVIVATGEIYVDDHIRLVQLFRSIPANARVARLLMIDSRGGQAGGGFRLGYIARSLRLTVMVARTVDEYRFSSGICASACTFVLAGGVKRIVAPGSVVGIHWAAEPPPRFDPQTGGFLYQPAVSDKELSGAFRRFFGSMGVSPKIVDLMRAVPAESGRAMTIRELRSLRLATAFKL